MLFLCYCYFGVYLETILEAFGWKSSYPQSPMRWMDSDGRRGANAKKVPESRRIWPFSATFFSSEVRGYLKQHSYDTMYLDILSFVCFFGGGHGFSEMKQQISLLSNSKNTTLRQCKATKNNEYISEFI